MWIRPGAMVWLLVMDLWFLHCERRSVVEYTPCIRLCLPDSMGRLASLLSLCSLHMGMKVIVRDMDLTIL